MTTQCDIAVNPEMYHPFYAGFQIPRLEVRNFAAMKISKIIEAPTDPTPEWGVEEWAKLRSDMHSRSKRELAENRRPGAK